MSHRKHRLGAAWRLRTTARRSGRQWRLLATVALVAVFVSTLLTSLMTLVTVTEQRGVRAALVSAPPEQTEVQVRVSRLSHPLADVRTRARPAVEAVLGLGASETAIAYTNFARFRLAETDRLVYFGVYDRLAEHATLTAGSWPTSTTTDAVAVAMPQAGAAALGLAVGDEFVIRTPGQLRELRVRVVGTYQADEHRYWGPDVLEGAGLDPDFPVPGTFGTVTTDAVGPLVLPEAAFEAAGLFGEEMVLRYQGDFGAVTAADLAPMLDRIAAAETSITLGVGDVGTSVRHTTRLQGLLREVSSALVVTRAGVLVVALLLLLLAVSALLQTARLLADSRHHEHNLMRARGAAGRQLLGLAGIEAAVVVVVAAACGPLLANLVYRLLARQPAMVEAGMAVDPGISAAAWITAAAVAAVLGAVIVSPLLRRGGTFVEGEQVRARPDRRAVLTRSGVDVLFVVLASLAYWQLRSYRSPVGRGGASLFIDPILVIGPTIVLLAGALLCVRLLPAISRLAERVAARARGASAPLAAWEVGRRSSRATAAVLLLTLALAVGTFSQAFLATWRQSQADQAAFQSGAPVRFEVVDADLEQAARLAAPEATVAPALRIDAELAAADAPVGFGGPQGRDVSLLALTSADRGLLQRDRLADEGGAAVGVLSSPEDELVGWELPATTRGIAATVRLGDAAQPLPVTSGVVRAVVADATGLLFTVELGTVPMDGIARGVRGLLPGAEALIHPHYQQPLRLVGLQTIIFVTDPTRAPTGAAGEFESDLLVRDLAALSLDAEVAADLGVSDDPVVTAADLTATELSGAVPQWRTLASGVTPMATTAPEGWQLGVTLSGTANQLRLGGAVVSQVGWKIADEVPLVVTDGMAGALGLGRGDRVQLILFGAPIQARVAAITPRVPTTTGEVVVVDHDRLSRAIAQLGGSGPAVNEWWVDVAPEDVDDYLAELPEAAPAADTAISQALLTREMLVHPLRVATQAGLQLAALAAAALAALGFGVHAVVTLRAREVEFAQLRAIGLHRRQLTGVVAVESALLTILGLTFGIGIGALLGWLVGPLVAVSADGTPPVPSVLVQLPWSDVALLAAEVAAILALAVLLVARGLRSDPAGVLRLGDER